MSKWNEIAGRIMVALDYPNREAAEILLAELKGIPCYVKVGMQLFYAAGPSFIERLKKDDYKVFLDLKLHDIPNTVRGGAQSITALGVDMFNVHAAGGIRMMEAAMEGIAAASHSGMEPTVIAVTQLTSTDQRTLNEEIGISGNVRDSVLRYAELAKRAGLHGVVASPLEVVSIKQQAGTAFLTVTPGVRPAGAELLDQARVMTPAEAFRQGTDYVVIGRPITAAVAPREALESILNEIVRSEVQ